MLETVLASVVLPAAIDLGKTVVNGISQYIVRKAGGVQPTTIAEKIELDKADVERLKAVAELDNPYGTPSQWVVDLRASFRYIAAAMAILGFFGALVLTGVNPIFAETVPLTAELAAAAVSFIFGERLLLKFKGAAK